MSPYNKCDFFDVFEDNGYGSLCARVRLALDR